MFLKTTLHKNYTLITLSKKPANAFCIDFLKKFINIMNNIDTNKAIIITGEGSIFSAGLDLFYISKINKTDFKHLVDTFEKLLLTIILHPAPTYTILNGHAIAGGFILLSCTDYCFTQDINYKIGLNENILNFSLPPIASAILHLKYKGKLDFFNSSNNISSIINSIDFITKNDRPINYINNDLNKNNSFFLKRKQSMIKQIYIYLEKNGEKHSKDFYKGWWLKETMDVRAKYLLKITKK